MKKLSISAIGVCLFFSLVGVSWEVGAVTTLYRITPFSKFVEEGFKWLKNGDNTIHVKYVGQMEGGRPHGFGELFWQEYKFFAGEGGMRVPMIISGTDSPLESGVTDAFSFVTDIVPTILQLAEVDDPQGRFRGETVERFTGRSLVPLLNQTALSVYREDEPIGYELGGNAALFKGKYKILKNRGPIGDGAWHLYNLTDDPGETEDLKTDESEKFEAMMADYRQYVDDFNVVPVPDDYDQRRQVLFYGIKNRMPGIVPILMVFSALIISVIGYRRFSGAITGVGTVDDSRPGSINDRCSGYGICHDLLLDLS